MTRSPSPPASDEVLIVGNGIAGFMIGIELLKLGFRCALVDASHQQGRSTTLRNEGWLHHGTYHAVSQPTHVDALKVTERCLDGSAHIRRHYSAAFERTSDRSIALVHESMDEDLVLDRWTICGVDHAPLTRAQASALLPELDLSTAASAYRVHDQPIHTGNLLVLLRAHFARLGGVLIPGEVTGLLDGGQSVELRQSVETTTLIRPRLVVWAAGYSGFGLVEALLPPDMYPRYWRSELMICEPLSDRSWFELQPDGLGHMNHLTHAVIGLNEDAVRVGPGDLLGRSLAPGEQSNFDEGLARLLGVPTRPDGARVISCIKIDLKGPTALPRDVNLRSLFVSPNILLALPGKMTEAPTLGVDVARMVMKALSGADVPRRLGDAWCDAQVILGRRAAGKAKHRFEGNIIVKEHSDPLVADLEQRIWAEQLADDPAVAPLRSSTTVQGVHQIAYDMIPGAPLDRANKGSDELGQILSALVAFQRRYQFGASPLTLYRDAVNENFLEDGGLIRGIDFSSSGQVRHQLDDLALFVASSPYDRDEILERYQVLWAGSAGHRSTSSSASGPLAVVGVRFSEVLDAAHRGYLVQLRSTPDHGSWTSAEAAATLASISFVELRLADLDWFVGFREARLAAYGRAPYQLSRVDVT